MPDSLHPSNVASGTRLNSLSVTMADYRRLWERFEMVRSAFTHADSQIDVFADIAPEEALVWWNAACPDLGVSINEYLGVTDEDVESRARGLWNDDPAHGDAPDWPTFKENFPKAYGLLMYQARIDARVALLVERGPA